MSKTAQLKAIQQLLKENADPNALAAQQKFVPGITKTYGIYTPVLNNLARQFKEGGFELVEALWQSGAWEERVLACKMPGRIAKKDPQLSLQLAEQFSAGISDWAVCDAPGMQALKPIVKTHRQEIFGLANKLSDSQNHWQRRLSLVLIEWYTRDVNAHAAIHKIVTKLEHDNEYYVQKAVVWIKRNLKKGR